MDNERREKYLNIFNINSRISRSPNNDHHPRMSRLRTKHNDSKNKLEIPRNDSKGKDTPSSCCGGCHAQVYFFFISLIFHL